MKKQAQEVQLPTLVPVTIPDKVVNEIKYLCKNIPRVEWSGILFYTVKGSIKRPSTLKIKIETILPLDMGTAGYTSYELDHRFIEFMEEDFETRCQWKVGHIHSHNVMKVFFSGMDKEELHDNAPNHNFYLSLIVNNYMDMMAKIAFVGSANKIINKVPFIALDENGEKYTVKTSDYKVEDTKLFIYDCEIKAKVEVVEVVDKFVKQTAEIMKPKPATPVVKVQQGQQMLPWQSQQAGGTFHNNGSNVQKNTNTPTGKSMLNLSNPFSKELENEEEEEEEEFDEQHYVLYTILKRILNSSVGLAEDEIDDLTVDDIAESIIASKTSMFQVATSAMDTYPSEYKKVYGEGTSEDFIMFTYDLIELMQCELEPFNEFKIVIKMIEKMIEKFIENERTTS